MRRREISLLLLCFLVSGATSLTLEVAWSKELSYVLGNTLYAVSSVVSAFMLGLGLGSALAGRLGGKIRRPLRAYALVQFGVAVCGVVSIPILRRTQPIFASLYAPSTAAGVSFLLVRFLVVFSLLLVPAVLMGMTLPVVAGALGRGKAKYDTEAGLAYGWNTLGAVLGTLVGGFLLIPGLGLLRTCIVAAILDLGIGGLALILDRKVGPITDIRSLDGSAAAASGKWSARQWWIAIFFGISGSVALALEVGWFRLLGLAMGPSVYAFAAMLGTYLTGVGLGSAFGSWWLAKTHVRGLPTMATLEAALGAIGLSSLQYMNALPTGSFRILRSAIGKLGEAGFAIGQLGISALVVLAPCLLMGLLFPVAVRALVESGKNATPERTVGRLYMLNTVGGISGSLATGFWLVPRLGVWSTLIAAGLTSGSLAAALFLFDGRMHVARRLSCAGAAVLVTAALAWGAPSWNVMLFNQGLYREGYKGQPLPEDRIKAGRLIFYTEGINAPVAVINRYEGATLFISGKADASTHLQDVDTQLLLGHLPVLFARQPRRAAVIGYGSGLTAHALLTHPEVQSLDIMEIEPGVIEASPFFQSINANPLEDPRTHLILEDGRIHLTYADSAYDCITSEPSNPWMAGVANLFTTDFYRTVRSRLSDDGIFAQWIQDYEISQEIYRVLLASLHDVFPYLVIFRTDSGDSIVLASGKPISIPWDVFAQRFAAPQVQESFYRTTWKNPHQILFLMQCPADGVERFLNGEHSRNTDDNVWLEHRMPFEMVKTGEGSGRVGRELVRLGAPHRIAALSAMLPGIPIEDCLREMILYPHTIEPEIQSDAILSDPWHDFRSVLLDGLRQELDAGGRADLSAKAAEWEKEGETYRTNRETASVKLRPMALQRVPMTLPMIEEQLTRAPDLPTGLLLAGWARENARDLDAAEHAYRQALSHPESRRYSLVLLGLCRVDWAKGRMDDAIACGETAMQQTPYSPDAYLLVATFQMKKENPAAARSCLERGLKLNPGEKKLEAMLSQIAPSRPVS